MRFWIAPLAMVTLAALAHANQLDDNYAALKTAQAAKDADTVMKLAPETSKLARGEAALPQPTDASQVADWKQRVEFAKDVDAFTEYALATTASTSTDQAKTIAMVDMLLAQNGKTTYLSVCASAYLEALGKKSSKEQAAGAQNILKVNPNNEDALYVLGVTGQNPTYAMRLVTVMKAKGKPEGVTEADWEKRKNMMLGQGYYVSGAMACSKSTWTDCDKDLRAAIQFVGKDPQIAGNLYFYLGLANYNLGKLTGDRSKIQEGEKFSEQSAALAGPMQQQALRNVNAMKQELAAPRR
ncbi:MAG TPA: hypothetical protein VGN17_03025 [Bryobacteraceae bacterium]|jgi:hypothetical protein